jgi:hypothetical protein
MHCRTTEISFTFDKKLNVLKVSTGPR